MLPGLEFGLYFKNRRKCKIRSMQFIIKFKYTDCLNTQFTLSSRNNENLILARPNQSLFVQDRMQIWISCVVYKNHHKE